LGCSRTFDNGIKETNVFNQPSQSKSGIEMRLHWQRCYQFKGDGKTRQNEERLSDFFNKMRQPNYLTENETYSSR
jgi:hypothetical protein